MFGGARNMPVLLKELAREIHSAVPILSARIDASELRTDDAISMAVPMILGGLFEKANTPTGVEKLFRAISHDHDGTLLDDLTQLDAYSGKHGQQILRQLLGSRIQELVDAISETAEIDVPAAERLLELLAPFVVSVLGRLRTAEDIGIAGLIDLLDVARWEMHRYAYDQVQMFYRKEEADVDLDRIMLQGATLLGNMLHATAI